MAAMFALHRNLGYMSRYALLVECDVEKNRGADLVSPMILLGLVRTTDGGNGVELTFAGEEWIKRNRDAMATLVVSRAVKTAPNSVFALAGMLPSKNLPKRQKEN